MKLSRANLKNITMGTQTAASMVEEKRQTGKTIPVYEKLEPGSCYIINRSNKDLLVACNVNGKVEVKRVPIPPRKGSSKSIQVFE